MWMRCQRMLCVARVARGVVDSESAQSLIYCAHWGRLSGAESLAGAYQHGTEGIESGRILRSPLVCLRSGGHPVHIAIYYAPRRARAGWLEAYYHSVDCGGGFKSRSLSRSGSVFVQLGADLLPRRGSESATPVAVHGSARPEKAWRSATGSPDDPGSRGDDLHWTGGGGRAAAWAALK